MNTWQKKTLIDTRYEEYKEREKNTKQSKNEDEEEAITCCKYLYICSDCENHLKKIQNDMKNKSHCINCKLVFCYLIYLSKDVKEIWFYSISREQEIKKIVLHHFIFQ